MFICLSSEVVWEFEIEADFEFTLDAWCAFW